MDSRDLGPPGGGRAAPDGNASATAPATPRAAERRRTTSEPAGLGPAAADAGAGAAPPDAGPPGFSTAAIDALVGTVIADRYRLVQRLGVGGMGAVYRGEHVSLRKSVAIKFLHRELSSNKELVTRFEREARAAATLEHPNVVGATDFGQLPDGTFFLVMEYVDGRTLRKVLQAELSMEPARAVRILKQIGAALQRAHSMNIVHRDLKPENVVVSDRDGEPDVVKVIDFGIARVSGSTLDSGGTALTAFGTVFGTPEYMAPEQAMGQPVDGRADQYALGVIAFELLTGQRPFSADDSIDLLRMQVGAPVPPVSSIAPGTSAAIDAVVARMMAKRPVQRYESVAAAMDAIDAALAAGGVPALPATRVSQASPVVPGMEPGRASTGPGRPSRPAFGGLPAVAWAGLAGLLLLSVIIGLLTTRRPRGYAPPPVSSAHVGMALPATLQERMYQYQQQPDVARAMQLSQTEQHAPAIALMAERRQRAPRDGLAAYFLGTCYSNAGRRGEALTHYAEALGREPELASDPTVIGTVVRSLHEPATVAAAERMVQSAPLASSRRAAEEIARAAITDARPDAHVVAAAHAYGTRNLLSALDTARVALRAARDCQQLTDALAALGRQGPVAQDDVRTVQRGDCDGLLMGNECRGCLPGGRGGRQRHVREEN